MKAKIQKFWYLKRMPPLYSPTKGGVSSTCCLSLPACMALRLSSEQARREREKTISPLGKAQLTEPSCFLLAVDSAETTAAEFIMVIFKGLAARIAFPTCQTHSLASGTPFPSHLFISY